MDNLSYFVYCEKDPHCSCCDWEYSNSEFDINDVEKMKNYVSNCESEGYSVTVILGEEVEL